MRGRCVCICVSMYMWCKSIDCFLFCTFHRARLRVPQRNENKNWKLYDNNYVDIRCNFIFFFLLCSWESCMCCGVGYSSYVESGKQTDTYIIIIHTHWMGTFMLCSVCTCLYTNRCRNMISILIVDTSKRYEWTDEWTNERSRKRMEHWFVGCVADCSVVAATWTAKEIGIQISTTTYYYYYHMNHMIEWNFNESEIGVCAIAKHLHWWKMYTDAMLCVCLSLCSRKYKCIVFIIMLIQLKQETKYILHNFYSIYLFILFINSYMRLIIGNVTMRLCAYILY